MPKRGISNPNTRFSRFEKKYITEPNSGCWLWLAATNGRYAKIDDLYAHRFSYEHFIGPIPDGLCVCHKCDNTICVNPLHLFCADHSENMKDCISKDRFQRGLGHYKVKYTDDDIKNIFLDKRNGITTRAIAKKYNICHVTIIKILNDRVTKTAFTRKGLKHRFS